MAEQYIELLSTAYLKVKEDKDISEALRKCKLEALQEIAGRLGQYSKGIWDPILLNGYAEKKSGYILKAENKTQIGEILKAPKPHYDGNKFQDGPYQVDEEELICWSEASLRRPPSGAAVDRMFELMYRVFPDDRLKSLEELTGRRRPDA